jgi:mRNA interferase MazF
MQQGSIVLVPFPFTDNPVKSKRRPAVVLSNTFLDRIGDVIVAAITSNLRSDEFSFQLRNENLNNPLPKQSEVRCHKILTISKSLIIKEIACLDESGKQMLFEKIKAFLQPEK